MLGGFTVGYAIPLWLGTGLFLLLSDVREFSGSNLRKEMKTTRFAGWFNLAAGVVLWIVSRVMA